MLSRLSAVAITFRILVALFTRTVFQPDEYYQSLEPAYHAVFGYGHLTWEWLSAAPIRSFVYPSLNVPVYLAAKVAKGRLGDLLVIYGPRFIHGALASLTDIWTAEIARNVLGKQYESAAFFLSLTSFFNALALSRSLSNSLETSLSALAFAHYPWDASVRLAPQVLYVPWKVRRMVMFSALACVVRPTNGVIWILLYSNLLWALRKEQRVLKKVLWEVSTIGFIAVALMLAADTLYYVTVTLTAYNFIKTNLSSGVSLFYGGNPWHFYITQALPILCTTSLPFVLYGAYLGWKTWANDKRSGRPLAMVGLTILWVGGIYSLAGHKEWRFIHPLLPLLNVLGAKGLVEYVPSSAASSTKDKKQAKAREKMNENSTFGRLQAFLDITHVYRPSVILVLLALPASLFVVLVYCSAPLSVMSFIRHIPSVELGPSTVGFLMPCHSTPGHAYIHRPQVQNGGVWSLGCEPPLNGIDMKTYRSQTDVFFADPAAYLETYFPPSVNPYFPPSRFPVSLAGQPSLPDGRPPRLYPWRHEWPRYLVLFGHLLEQEGVQVMLEAKGYQEVWNKGWWWEGDDEKRKGGVRVWKWLPHS